MRESLAMNDTLTPSQRRIAAWFTLLDEGDELLLAGLRHQHECDEDIRVAYRRWHEVRWQEHDRAMRRTVEGFCRRDIGHDR